jgi:hypothetical protein
MKKLLENEEVSLENNPVNGNQEDLRVIVTHLLNDLSPEQVKLRVLNFLAEEKGRLEFINGNVILCFSNLKDKIKFLTDLRGDMTLKMDKMSSSA